MKVKTLIKILQACEPEYEVLLPCESFPEWGPVAFVNCNGASMKSMYQSNGTYLVRPDSKDNDEKNWPPLSHVVLWPV